MARVNIARGRSPCGPTRPGLTDDEGGIWQSGGGLMSDGPGRIFVATGNGVSPAPGPGPAHRRNSATRWSGWGAGCQRDAVQAQDFFSPANAPALDATDSDFGAGGPVGLPFGSQTFPNLLVQAGKDGRVFLLNRDNLGGREQGPGEPTTWSARPAVRRPVGAPGRLRRHPDADPSNTASADDYVYYVGNGDYLRCSSSG